MKELLLLRGCPNAGKSTIAKLIGGVNFEADMYFIGPDGTYNFKPESIKDAHKWCQDMVKSSMEKGEEKIVVSNTFTQEWEMKIYYDMAEQFGYRVHSLIVERRHNGKNEHGVPDEKIELMKKRFETKI